MSKKEEGGKKTTPKSVDQLWDEIGFHRPLGGFWYKISLNLISMIFGLAFVGIYYKLLYPWPESAGYRSAATGVFTLFFSVFDLGTNMTMDRFIAEARIKDPQKMIKYIQYYIWYQMLTGLIQTTLISAYALFWVPRTELGYSVWIMLIHSTVQYPGFLGVFGGVLSSLQQFHKKEVLSFVSGDFIQRMTEIIFVLWGRRWGETNAAIGPILGIAVGATIGLYIDDFFATILAAYYMEKTMRKDGITIRRCFQIEFDRELVKECLSFGIKTGMPGVFGLVAELIILYEWIHYVPQYTSFVALYNMADSISGIVNYGMGIALTQLFAEAYLNGKVELTRYYITQYIRFATMVQMFVLAIITIILLVLKPVYVGLDLNNYILAIPFIIPQIIRQLQQPFTSLADSILLGTNHPNFLSFIRFTEEILKIIFMTLWLVVLNLPIRYGLTAIKWIMPCGIYPAILYKTIWNYFYIHKKILKIQINWWQTFIAPMIAAIITYIVGYIAKELLFDPILERYNVYIAIVVFAFSIMIAILVLFFPLTVLFGGWDDDSVREFQKAAMMSGPSRPIVIPMFYIVKLTSKLTPLHNRFRMDTKKAIQEAQELIDLKNSHKITIK